MISVIMYGRNDAHGYNLHRRAALSLNCIAEVLTDPDDEIIFVDYNTPDELPTFIEALGDTLSERCLGLLRVLRVPASLHTERFRDRTHLVVAEPVARNAAARRANPANRWLLSTNTDMIFIPLQGESLSEICRDLTDGYYALPRFELPEWIWERLPRADPRQALVDVERLGPALCLDEPTLNQEWVRYDAPGDFQLILQDDFVAVDGFDEEMLLGWHVDSNLNRRMHLHRGSIETLEGRLAAYHGNHARVPTVYHGAERIENDLDRFFLSVARADVAAQRATWGLADVVLDEVPLRRQIGPAFVHALLATLPAASGPRHPSSAADYASRTAYDSLHVLPFIADSLVVSPLTRIGYLGVNPVLRDLLARLVAELGLSEDLVIPDLSDAEDVDALIQSADLFIVDFGTDLSALGESNVTHFGDGSVRIPAGLDHVFMALERLVEVERARLGSDAHPRRVVLVNSANNFVDPFVSAEFAFTWSSTHCPVRRATVKAVPDDEASGVASRQARALVRWAFRSGRDTGAFDLVLGEGLRFADLDNFSGLGTGWLFPDACGLWTWGSRSELSVAFPDADTDVVLVLVIDNVCVAPGESVKLDVFANDVRVASRDFGPLDSPFGWRVELPPHVVAAGRADLTITADEPHTPRSVGWSPDERPLGFHLHSMALAVDDAITQDEADRSVEVHRPVSFAEGSGGERFLGEGWSAPEPTGVWTIGEKATILLQLPKDIRTNLDVILRGHAYVSAEHPEVEIVFSACGERLGARVFGHGMKRRFLRLPLAGALRDAQGRIAVDIDVDRPASPEELGTGSDPRLLGFHLQWLVVCRTGVRGRWNAVHRRLRRGDLHRGRHEPVVASSVGMRRVGMRRAHPERD
jgi:hypothetical protein